MYVEKIKLKNFRNYSDIEVEFNKKVNIFIGNNAQGKTNLLESIYLTSIGRSFRTNKYMEMIQFNKDFLKVNAKIIKKDYDTEVEVTIENSNKNIKIDGISKKKTSELLENLYIVIFSPEDLKIVKDEPEKRRRFIDRELCQINPSYFSDFTNYKNVLLQRNSLLKENNINLDFLDILDIQLSKYGSAVIEKRKKFIEKINSISSEIHNSITKGSEKLEIFYSPNIEYKKNNFELEELFYNKLKDNRNNDLKQRTTTLGPHKDDLQFFINGINVRSFGSQGQQRTTALSLKLAEIKIIKEEKDENPILLLDDLMSELDKVRQEYLIKSLSEVQLFITTTEISESILNKFSDKKIFYIEKGNI